MIFSFKLRNFVQGQENNICHEEKKPGFHERMRRMKPKILAQSVGNMRSQSLWRYARN